MLYPGFHGINVSIPATADLKLFNYLNKINYRGFVNIIINSIPMNHFKISFLTFGSSIETIKHASASCLFGMKFLALGPENASWISDVI